MTAPQRTWEIGPSRGRNRGVTCGWSVGSFGVGITLFRETLGLALEDKLSLPGRGLALGKTTLYANGWVTNQAQLNSQLTNSQCLGHCAHLSSTAKLVCYGTAGQLCCLSPSPRHSILEHDPGMWFILFNWRINILHAMEWHGFPFCLAWDVQGLIPSLYS